MAEVARINQHQEIAGNSKLADRHDRIANQLDDYVEQLKGMQINSVQLDLADELQGQVETFQSESIRQRNKSKQLRGE